MRILVYNWRDLKHPLAGGAEVYTDAVAREWVKMGHSVTLFCAAVEGEPEREIAAGGYQIVRKGSRHGVYREAKKFWKNEGKSNFDLVIDEVNTRPFFCASFVKEANVVALIHQVAREVWFYESVFPMSILGRFVLEPWWLWRIRNANVITVSASSKRSIERYGVKNVAIVPEGYEHKDKLVAVKEADPTLVFLGRLSANKRPGDAIKAFQIVRKSIPNAKMWIIGDGPERIALERNSGAGIDFLGRLSEEEKSKLLATAHLLVVTSVREGWGMVVTEAAFLGTPAIGYDVDGLKDSLAAHGGQTVKASPDCLAKAIIEFYGGKTNLFPQTGLAIEQVYQWGDVAKSILEKAGRGGSSKVLSDFDPNSLDFETCVGSCSAHDGKKRANLADNIEI